MSTQIAYPDSVRIVEVGLRDGLQNEQQIIPMQVKLSLLHRLEKTGLRSIELTGFVHPLWVPQLADAESMLSQHQPMPGIQYPVLVPNLTGMQRALAAGAQEIAVFTAASEGFNQKNINCSIEESLQRSAAVIELAKANSLRVRGYISCVLGCPIDGKVKVAEVVRVAERLLALGCDEISLGDTIGVGTPLKAKQMLEAVAAVVPMPQLAVHFHDTNGQALANILACLESGVQVVDSSIAGLGGCPYAPGATGNVASEDVVYMLNGMGIESGINLDALVAAGHFISGALGRTNASAVGRAWKH
ncbi:MAG: hydroxymethylglutaryl-CoA lyase [Xanthomonadales bacterium]|nr:hydroxymethylglutaryl-CoA lyase [Xanthomonadales bacterium]